MSPERVQIEVDGRELTLSNLEKVLFPQSGFTKGQLIDYYAKVAPMMLPHVANRPVTLRRYPNGVDAASFFEKHVPSHAPKWVRTVRVPSVRGDSSDDDEVTYAVVSDLPTLVWAANLATIEFHVPLWRIRSGARPPSPPDFLVFDLDPGPGASIVECCSVAGWIEVRLAKEGLEPALPKTSGSKGLQLYSRLAKRTTWPKARELALAIAQAVETEHPDLVVTNMRKELRGKKVLIDWSQNHPAKTTVAVYSVRARPNPFVSTPVSWGEVKACERAGDPSLLQFTTADVLGHVEQNGDLFSSLVPG